MNKTLIVLAGGALLLSCCGCTSDVSSESAADNPQTTVTSSTAATESENAVSTSDTTNTDIVTNPDSQPDVTEAVTMFQGWIGDEQTAETPKPEFFVYRFQPDGFAVRLFPAIFPLRLITGSMRNIILTISIMTAILISISLLPMTMMHMCFPIIYSAGMRMRRNSCRIRKSYRRKADLLKG